MINILYINHVAQISGAEQSLLYALAALDRSRFFPIVVCPADGLLAQELRRLKIQTEFLDFIRFRRTFNVIILLGWLVRYLGTLWKLSGLISRYRIRLIHANSTSAQLYGSVAAGFHRIPSIWHVRDLVSLGLLGRMLYKISAGIIVPSAAVKREIEKYGPGGPPPLTKSPNSVNDARRLRSADGKLRKIYNGIALADHGYVSPGGHGASSPPPGQLTIREELGLDPDSPLIAMIGQLVAWKGHRDFLQSVRLVADEIPAIRALIVGEDLFGDQARYRQQLQDQRTASDLHHHVIFTGYRRDVRQIMTAIDILVVPSWKEPFGRVILEAMVCATPVIATDTGGPPEIIKHGETGILVPPRKPPALAQAIIHLVNNPDLRVQMGNAARLRVENCFDIEQVARQVQALYHQLIPVDQPEMRV